MAKINETLADENSQLDKSTSKGHNSNKTTSFKSKLIGCGIVRGEMNEKIWQTHSRQKFKSIIDLNDLVRKCVCIEFDHKHVKLKSDDNDGAKNLVIFRHKIKTIVYGYKSTKSNYICYLCKISNSTHQLVVIEATKHSGLFVSLIRKCQKNSLNASNLSMISLNNSAFEQSPSPEEESDDTDIETEANEGDSNNSQNKNKIENKNKDKNKSGAIEYEVIDISSSESEDEAMSDIDIVDILPPVPFRNHTFTNIEDD